MFMTVHERSSRVAIQRGQRRRQPGIRLRVQSRQVERERQRVQKRCRIASGGPGLGPEAREAMLVQLEAALAELAKAYKHMGGTTDWFWRPSGTAKAQSQRPGREQSGTWLDGEQPVYADFVVGAWLKMLEAGLPAAEWQRVWSCQGGFWGQLVDALSKWTAMN